MFFVVSHTISIRASFNDISSGRGSRKEKQTQDSPLWKLKKISVHFDDDLSVFSQVEILLSLLTMHLRNEALANKSLQKAWRDFSIITLQLHATGSGQIATSTQLQAKAPLPERGAALPERDVVKLQLGGECAGICCPQHLGRLQPVSSSMPVHVWIPSVTKSKQLFAGKDAFLIQKLLLLNFKQLIWDRMREEDMAVVLLKVNIFSIIGEVSFSLALLVERTLLGCDLL